jgi:two-component system, NarL family, response regulator NreC
VSDRIRVLIVDDHAVVREGVRSVLATDARIDVIGEAGDGEQALALVAAHTPDVVVMDLSMPRVNGSQATRNIVALAPATKVVVLSAHPESAYVRDALRSGASGYVVKRTVVQDLLRAIHVVHAGGTFLDFGLASHAATADLSDSTPAAELSTREIDVASLVARGYTNAEIASTLTIAVKTVETHKTRIMKKLALGSRAALVRYAVYRGWLEP